MITTRNAFDHSPDRSLYFQDLTLVLQVEQLMPSALDSQTLYQADIIPSDWQLTRQPAITDNLAQFNFRGGKWLSAYPHQIVLTEFIGTQEWQAIVAPEVLIRLIHAYPDLTAPAIAINPQGYLFGQLPPQADPTLPNSWYGIGQIHTFEVQCPDWCKLNLALEQDYLVVDDRRAVPIVRFAGNFHHSLEQFHPSQRGDEAKKVLQAWNLHLKTIQRILPGLFCMSDTFERLKIKAL